MKLPNEIIGNNKIRDAAIVKLYAQDNLSMEEIGSKFNLTGSRVQQIVYANRHLLKFDKEYEKTKRINHLKRLLKDHPNALGKKGTLEILDQLRVETEGNKIEHSGEIKTGETKIIIVRPQEAVIEARPSIV